MDTDSSAGKRRGSGSSHRAASSPRNSDSGYGGEDMDRVASSDSMEMSDLRSDDEDLDDDEETGLTHTQRKKRRRRKEQNARLDGQISGAGANMNNSIGGTTEEEEKKISNPTLLRGMVTNVLLIGLWYSFSISISVYNKWMFSKENLDFHYPLFTTSLHMLVQFSLAGSFLFFIPRLRPSNAAYTPGTDPHEAAYRQLDGTDHEDSENTASKPPSPPSNAPLMTKWFYLSRIGPCGTATALDIGLGNFSLRFISLTFFTMCKSSVLAFVLLFAFIFHLESPTWKLCIIILFMTAGVIMMVAGETAFSALGFILVMTASLCSGFRWSLTQILLLRNRATSNPFSSIFFLTPVMFMALFLLALPIEGPRNVIQGIRELSASHGGFYSFCLLLFPGILAFLMVSAEFALLKRTSVVTLSVCGIFKEVLTISAAGIVFGDELSPINVSGLIVTIASIAAYNYLKYSTMRSAAVKEAHEAISAEQQESRPKSGIDVAADGGGRRDRTTSLMRDSLDPPAGVHGAGQSKQTNGVLISDGLDKQHDR